MRIALLTLHILGGTVGLLAGAVAMVVRKGGPRHRAAGHMFTAAMLALAASGLVLAAMKSQPGNVVGGVSTLYLLTTAWRAGRPRDVGWPDRGALLVGLGSAAVAFTLGVQGLRPPARADGGASAGMSLVFGVVLLLAAAGDARMLARGGLAGRPRVVRHLWRMCFGLFIATGSFFLGQQQVFPAALRGSALLAVLALLPLPLLVYWLVRVRIGRSLLGPPRPTPVPTPG